MIKIYYSPELNILEQYRLIPVPQISITQNLNYNNDIIIGYTYSINIRGYASNYIAQYIESVPGSGELSTENSEVLLTQNDIIIITDESYIESTLDTTNLQDNNISLPKVLYSIELVRSILSRNGGNLTIRDTQNNNLLVAKNGTLKSLTFENTNNNWTKFAAYNATIEFNELLIFDEPITCNSGYINQNSITSGLLDLNQYHISSFSEGWSFNIDDSSLNYSTISDTYSQIKVLNTTINVSYNLSATGGNYFIDDEIIPGWLQAKNFAQKRLYDQVKNFNSILALNSQSGCSPINNLASINNYGSGLFNNIGTNYGLYNETVTCDTSESEGSFNLVYNAILKINEDENFSDSSVIHKFNKDYSVSKEGQKSSISISINGTVEGLCDGGLIATSGNFSLPQDGTLLVKSNNNSKFNNALSFLPKIISNNDLISSFKTALGVTLPNLFVSGVCTTGIPPVNFSLTKNYMEGTISYSVEYTTDRTCSLNGSTSVLNITIDVEDPVPVIAEIVVPNGNYIIQDIGTYTAKNINVTIEGKTLRNCCSVNNVNDTITAYCATNVSSLTSGLNLPNENSYIVKDKSYSVDPIQGTYSLNLSYICSTGCYI